MEKKKGYGRGGKEEKEKDGRDPSLALNLLKILDLPPSYRKSYHC